MDDLIKIGTVLRFLSKPQPRLGRDHLAHKEFTHQTIEQVQLEPINDLADIVIQCLNKVDLEQLVITENNLRVVGTLFKNRLSLTV